MCVPRSRDRWYLNFKCGVPTEGTATCGVGDVTARQSQTPTITVGYKRHCIVTHTPSLPRTQLAYLNSLKWLGMARMAKCTR